MISEKDIQKIKSFSEGNLEESGYPGIYDLFSENENDPEFEKLIKLEFYEYIKNNPEEDFHLSYLLDRIHHAIHHKEIKTKRTVIRKICRWYSVAAAVLLIPLLIAGGIWVFFGSGENNVIVKDSVTATLLAPMGSRISFTLPDGTEGWLNSGSSLEYQVPFNNNRLVDLKGEVWFHVAKDEVHPFEVTAGKSSVKVLGTKFCMNAYPDEKYVEVVLEEGKVEFQVPGLASTVKMKPNERLIFNSDSIKISTTEAYKYSGWKEGKLIFRGDPMGEVARRIMRWYNVDVELVDKQLENYVIRGTFQDDSLEEVLKYLAMTSPIKYRILARKVLDDGTLQKTKVLVYKKDNI